MSVVMMMRAHRHNDANNPRPSGTLMMIASLLSVMQLSKINRRVDLTCDLRVGDARGVTSLRMVHQTTTSTT